MAEAEENVQGSIRVSGIQDILQERAWSEIDLLKVDVEGGEKDIFDGPLDWLKQTKLVAIEIHDEFGCRNHIETNLKSYGFELLYSGELTIGVNVKLIARA